MPTYEAPAEIVVAMRRYAWIASLTLSREVRGVLAKARKHERQLQECVKLAKEAEDADRT